jgi:hypothetical protein
VSRGERFTFGPWTWDVDAALQLVDDGRPVEQLPVESLARLLVLVFVDLEYAATVDLSRPLLLAPVPAQPGYVMPIDGMHRIARAQAEGVATLPARALTVEESERVLVQRRPKRR